MISNAMNDLIELGCSRVLTSGQRTTAFEGSVLISELISKYRNQIIIMPGGGLNPENLGLLLNACYIQENDAGSNKGCGQHKVGIIKEFHASARTLKESKMKYRNELLKMGSDSQEFSTMVTSTKKVREMVDIFTQFTVSQILIKK